MLRRHLSNYVFYDIIWYLNIARALAVAILANEVAWENGVVKFDSVYQPLAQAAYVLLSDYSPEGSLQAAQRLFTSG